MGAVAMVAAGAILLTSTMMLRLRRRRVYTGHEEMIGSAGKVIDWSGDTGQVRVQGEVWQARSKGPIEPGGKVRVTELDGLTIVVEPQGEGG